MPTDMTEEQKLCRLCLKPFVAYPLGTKNDYALEACKACGSIVVNPFPTQDQLDGFYGDIQPQITHIPNHDAEIIRIKKILMKLGNDLSGKRFIDVSARQGYGVKAAHLIGMKAFGIDPHDFFVEFAQSKYPPDMFKHITVQDYAATSPVKYDYVFSEQSICEQVNIESYIASLASLVAPGGLIYIEEADGNHWNLPRSFANWAYVDPPMNFIFPSKTGMEAILGRYNLRIQKMYFTWKPFMRMVVQRMS